MKKIIAGLAILLTGYGIALLFPPDRIPLFKNFDLSLIKAKSKDVVDDTIEKTTREDNSEEGPSSEVHEDEEPRDIESRLYENPTYLREIDLFQIPGLGTAFSLRVGLPLPEAAANDLLEKLPTTEPAFGARFQTATGAAKVIVLYGELENRDQAELLRDSLQQGLSERLEVVYLPACVYAGETDDAGFYCGEALSKAAETNPPPNI